MFKAVDATTSQHVVILDVQDDLGLELLREKGRANHLHCPGCHQAVIVRAGELKRPHFAHRHLGNCPLSHDSPELLEARAVLYRWLRSKFSDGVTLEKQIPRSCLPRPIDCWVEFKGHRFAYWIVDRRMKVDDRRIVAETIRAIPACLITVFHHHLLDRGEAPKGKLLLSTTEREFIAKTRYDDMYGNCSLGSLHYLDPEHGGMTTFRALSRIEYPQRFAGDEMKTPLAALLVSPQTGAIVHPGERERVQQWEAARAEELRKQMEAKRRDSEEHAKKHAELMQRQQDEQARGSTPKAARFPVPLEPTAPLAPEEREGICEYCNERTRDWVVYHGATGQCQCRRCAMAKQQRRCQTPPM